MDLPTAPARTLRIACVTETYPPEVNGVAVTIDKPSVAAAARNTKGTAK